ncbi:hypothetical protein [Bacillus cereus]|nr:hypothetical protein [Bacillus cereus]
MGERIIEWGVMSIKNVVEYPKSLHDEEILTFITFELIIQLQGTSV